MITPASYTNDLRSLRNWGDFPEVPEVRSLRQDKVTLPEEVRNSAQGRFKPDDPLPTRKIKTETQIGETKLEITATRPLPSHENLLPTPQQQRIWADQFIPLTTLVVTSALKVPTINGSIGTSTTFNSDGSLSSDQKVTFGINASKLEVESSTSGAASATFSTPETDKIYYQIRGAITPVPVAPNSSVTTMQTEFSVQTTININEAAKLNFSLNTNGNVILGGSIKSGCIEATGDYNTFTGDVNTSLGIKLNRDLKIDFGYNKASGADVGTARLEYKF